MTNENGRWLLAALAALMVGWCLPAAAQGPPPPPMSVQDFDELMGKIARVRAFKMVEALDLDEETGIRLSVYLREHDDERAEIMRQRQALHRRVAEFISSGGEDDALAGELIEEGIALERRNHDVSVEIIRGLDGVLSPSQQLRFVMANREFEREVMEIIRQQRGGPPRGGPGHGPPR